MAFFLEELVLEGVAVQSIQACEITGRMGAHGQLYLTACIGDEEQSLERLTQNQEIYLWLKKGERKFPLFYGLITNTMITCSGGMVMLVLEAKTLSYRMDIEIRSRSFQNRNLTYQDVVKQVLETYDASLKFMLPDQAIGDWLIQYEETDWQFINRILSMLGGCLTPAAEFQRLSVWAGIPEGELFHLPYEVTQINKDLYSYYYHVANGADVLPVNYTSYRIKSTVMQRMFDRLAVDKISFPILELHYTFERGQLMCDYLVQKKAGVRILPVYPMQLVGVALPGRIAGVQEDLVQVHLDIDGAQAQEYFWMPYSTVSAAADGSGWYCMPELGDLVNVYFPCKDVSKAIALNAVNDYAQPSSGADRMGDVSRVYLSTRHDKTLLLDGGGIKISGGGTSSLGISSDGVISLNASKELKVRGSNSVTLEAEGCVRLNGVAQVSATDSGLNASITIAQDGEILITGQDIQLD